MSSLFKDRGGGQFFSTSFWMRFSQAPLCRYRFKVIFDNIIFLLSGNIMEYTCFWRFNSILMTWNKWLGFTKSVIMGLNTLTLPAWCCLFTVRNHMTLFIWFQTHTILWSTCYFLLLTLFCTFCSLFHTMANTKCILIFLSHWYSHINFNLFSI